MLQVVALCAGLVAALAPMHARAQATSPYIYEAKFGVLAHDVPDLWSGFRLERGVDINGELLLAPALPVLGGAIRPVIGGTVNTEGYTSKAYFGARWQIETSIGIYFGLGLGAGVHDGHLVPDAADRKALGGRWLFHIPAEIGYRFDHHHSISIYFEHMSNGNTQTYNEALDSLGLRYGYRF
jgi:lipid A 3-O-deacylase